MFGRAVDAKRKGLSGGSRGLPSARSTLSEGRASALLRRLFGRRKVTTFHRALAVHIALARPQSALD